MNSGRAAITDGTKARSNDGPGRLTWGWCATCKLEWGAANGSHTGWGWGLRTHLQQEPRALWHELQSHQGHGAGQRTDDDKHSPAVVVVIGTHAEAPTYGEQSEDF